MRRLLVVLAVAVIAGGMLGGIVTAAQAVSSPHISGGGYSLFVDAPFFDGAFRCVETLAIALSLLFVLGVDKRLRRLEALREAS